MFLAAADSGYPAGGTLCLGLRISGYYEYCWFSLGSPKQTYFRYLTCALGRDGEKRDKRDTKRTGKLSWMDSVWTCSCFEYCDFLMNLLREWEKERDREAKRWTDKDTHRSRVAPDTEWPDIRPPDIRLICFAGYPVSGRIAGWIVKGRHKKNNRLTFFQ